MFLILHAWTHIMKPRLIVDDPPPFSFATATPFTPQDKYDQDMAY